MTSRAHFTPRVRHRWLSALMMVFSALLLVACGKDVRRFPVAEPMWDDVEDRRPFAPVPEEYYSPFAWDGGNYMFFRPLSHVFLVEAKNEAVNVNAMDEVPNSSWFVNRLSRERLSTERIVQASCGDQQIDPAGPWVITNAKPNGANPGFIIEDARGIKYLLKFDGYNQPERATAADVIGSIIYWAAGYYTPCNRIVYFDRDILTIEEGATATVAGRKVPLTWERLAPVFENRVVVDGKFRATASQFLPGRPVGPWRYEDTRSDDPNDVIPHQERRELRGAYVLASWINHFDSREQNTLAMWIADEEDPDTGYIRHNYIDFGDSFGSEWRFDGISRRLGHSAYLDMKHLLADLVTLGTIPRPWHGNTRGPAGSVLGYFNVETFEPDKYRTGYPNPAFIRSSERDNAWMTRILANFPPEAIEAAVTAAQFDNEIVHSELIRILTARREKILRRWFRNLSPLTWPQVLPTADGAQVCMRDLAVATGIIDWEERPYWARAWQLRGERRLSVLPTGRKVRHAPDHICVGLPSAPDVTEEEPAYLIVDVAGMYGFEDSKSRPLRMHFYQFGAQDYRLVGVERPYDLRAPRRKTR